MDQPDISKATIDKLAFSFAGKREIELDMLRLDKIHPVISGNKWFKLKYHLENYYSGNYQGILTFGGAWSNHIAAVACACNLQKIKCAGVIRGEKPANLSLTLQEAANYNMGLKFTSREIYKKKNTDDFLKEIKKEFSNYYIIPEGGAGDDGEKGAGEILNLVTKNNYSHIACAIGTATMFNGISKSLNLNQLAIGIPVLKGFGDFPENSSSKIFSQYHLGGYAKANEELFGFMNDFFEKTNIPTDFVYTGKLTFAICDLVKNNFFPKGSKVLIIHSGGLQGNLSLPKGTLIF